MLPFIAAMAGFVAGCVLQLQQPTLWEGWIYGLFMLPALAVAGWFALDFIANSDRRHVRVALRGHAGVWLLCALMAAALGWGQTGLRASVFAGQALDRALEGVDLRVTGVIAGMPQRDESGLRFRIDVESAYRLASGGIQPVKLPPRVQLAWYRSLPRLSEEAAAVPFAELQAAALPIRAGERWQMVVRLKAPHGNLNPHGFDYELCSVG